MNQNLSKMVLSSFLILNFFISKAQNWEFKKGGQITNEAPVYNTLGSANATTTPGARMGMAGFVDPTAQTLYLFGGQNGTSYYNSTFVYNTGTGNWNYTTGANTANANGIAPTGLGTEYPSARAGMGYIAGPQGTSARMVISGGFCIAADNNTSGLTNAVWNTSTTTPNYAYNLGAWQSGSFNFIGNYFGGFSGVFPGAQNYPCFFSESSLTQRWHFGGIDADGFTNNAMLKANNMNANTYTRVAGSTDREDPGTYNGEGNNGIPAARAYAAYWRDAAGNFWIFGGSNPSQGAFNDLWKFNPTTNQFTLIKGNTANTTANYGTVNFASPTTFPPARTQAAAVVGADGNFYIFGGANGTNYYNDLWQFNTTTNRWVWLKGSNTANTQATYGALATANTTPGARKGAMAWHLNNTMYIYGGEGYANNSTIGRLGDLWAIPLNNFTVTLPLGLENFNAVLNTNNTLLTWNITASNTNSHFEIEYSNDGINFNKVGSVNANNSNKYTYNHTINNGLNHFYRLKIYQQNETFRYSNILILKQQNNLNSFNVYPNIIKEQATLTIKSTNNTTATIKVVNAAGKMVIKKTLPLNIGTQTSIMEFKHLQKGLYYIILNKNGKQETKKVILN